MRKIPDDVRAEEGRALARLGDGGWDPLVQAGPARRALRRRAGRRRRRGGARAGARRSRGSPRCRRAAAARSCPTSPRGSPPRSGCPFAAALERTGDGPPQREMANSAQQVANVRGQFAVARRAAAGPVPARRRRPLQRLDARDARGPAAPPRRAGGLPARARARRSDAPGRRAPRCRRAARRATCSGSSLIGTCPQPRSHTCRASRQQPPGAARLRGQQQRVARAPGDRDRHGDLALEAVAVELRPARRGSPCRRAASRGPRTPRRA